tara:strand:- start:244 stop:1509 length:1266 start_codon:yes stop_codon:yes gene_type:complete
MTQKKVLLRSPLLTQSGYGEHGRFVLRALRSREDLFDVYIHATDWGKTSWKWEDNEERVFIDEVLQKTMQYAHASDGKPEFDAAIQVTIPNEWDRVAPVNVGVTAGIETTKVAPVWLEKGNAMDHIITVSQHSKQTYENASYKGQNRMTEEPMLLELNTPVDVVHYPVRAREVDHINLELTTDFNFVAVQLLAPRKNTNQLVEAFVEEFRDNDDVGLILKANIMKNCILDRRSSVNQLVSFLASLGEYKCKVYLLHGFMSDKELNALYTHPKVKAYITTTHGEGFGLPLFEAAGNGLPVIAPDWSGHVDFLYKPTRAKKGKSKNKAMFSRISYTLRPISTMKWAEWPGVIEPDSMWAFPEMGSIKMCMEEVYKDHGRFKKQAKQLQNWILENFTEEQQYEKMVNSIMTAFNKEEPKEEKNA